MVEHSLLPIRRHELLVLRILRRSSTVCIVRPWRPWERIPLTHTGGISAESMWKLVAELSVLFTSSLPLVYWGNLIQQGYNNISIVWTVIRAARCISNSTVGLNKLLKWEGVTQQKKQNSQSIFSHFCIASHWQLVLFWETLNTLTQWACNAMFLLCQVPLQNNSSLKNSQELKAARGVLTLACVPEVSSLLLLVLNNTSHHFSPAELLIWNWIHLMSPPVLTYARCAQIRPQKNRKSLCSSFNNLISRKQQGTKIFRMHCKSRFINKKSK